MARLAEEFQVPILMHFQHGRYNTGIENMHKTLEKYPKVNFIGHAQTWWANVDAKHDQAVLYPTTRVTPPVASPTGCSVPIRTCLLMHPARSGVRNFSTAIRPRPESFSRTRIN